MSILNNHLKMEYLLPALTLSKKEYGDIIKIVKDASLPHSSICRKFPINLVHGTSDYLESGMENLYIMQGSYKIEIVNEFLSISEVTGSLLRPEIECSTIHVGIGRNILSLDYYL